MEINAEFLREFRAAMGAAGKELSGSVERFLESSNGSNELPARLFHFTDCQGLIGILQAKTLHASLATALSDASETKYAMARVTSQLQANQKSLKHLPSDVLCRFLTREERIEGLHDDARSYVASFCGDDRQAIHWLHYGRSGTGVAIAFDASKLDAEQFSMCRVTYSHEKQDVLIAALLTIVDEFVGEHRERFVGAGKDLFARISCHLAAMYLRLLATRLKDPAFEPEDEWRLITNEVWVDGKADEPTRPTAFRATAGRVVPYKVIELKELPIVEIILGASTPMANDEQALRVLMENTIGRTVPIRRSTTAVRP